MKKYSDTALSISIIGDNSSDLNSTLIDSQTFDVVNDDTYINSKTKIPAHKSKD